MVIDMYLLPEDGQLFMLPGTNRTVLLLENGAVLMCGFDVSIAMAPRLRSRFSQAN